MDIFALDQNFQPLNLVENFSSMIWSERYSSFGDFELKSNDIVNTMDLLPRESYITLRNSTVPMVVENYKINKPLRAAPTITVTGRSFETVTERRVSVKSLPGLTQRAAWTIPAAKESDAAYRAMRLVLGDEARYQGTQMVLPQVDPAVSLLDAIDEIDLTLPADYQTPAWDSTVSYSINDVVGVGSNIYKAILAGVNHNPTTSPTYWTVMATPGSTTWPTSYTYDIKAGNLYATVLDLINVNRRGLKAVRPDISGSKVGIEIYNGANLTDLVIIDARFDQFDDSTYLLSQQGSTNVGYVYGVNGSQVVLKNTAPEPSGLSRRVLLVDQTSDATTNTIDIRKARGLIELYKYNATALFDGSLASQISAGYNRDYFLGDIIKLTGEYGLSQNVRVSEFIRSFDSSGERSYPAFEAVDD